MIRLSQRLAYEALAATLAAHELALIVGVPTSIQSVPGAYLVSTVLEVMPNRLVSRLRPTLTLVEAWQDSEASEWAIVDLVDDIAPALVGPLADVCRSTIEAITYGWRDISGVTYRVADLSVVLTQM